MRVLSWLKTHQKADYYEWLAENRLHNYRPGDHRCLLDLWSHLRSLAYEFDESKADPLQSRIRIY